MSTRGTESDSIQVGLVKLHAGNDQLNSALPTAASLAAGCLNGNGLLDGSRVLESDHGDAADLGVFGNGGHWLESGQRVSPKGRNQ